MGAAARRRTTGTAGRVVVALAGVALLAGCTSTVAGDALPADLGAAKPTVPAAGPGGADPAAPPVVGTCHRFDEGQEHTPLDPPDPVSCGDEHHAETAVVGDTGLGEDDEWPSEDELYDDGALGDAFSQLCSLDDVVAHLGGDDQDDPYAFYAAFLPAEDQWEAGARWMRCDVFYGYSSPEPAPGVMAGALTGPDAAAYRVCFAGSATDHRVVPCSEPHGAEPTGYALADLPADAPYPDEPTRQNAAASCTDAVGEYVGGPPPFGYAVAVWVDSPEDWEGGGDPRCVLVPAGGGTTTGSVRP